jgi:hypothetical protein
VAEVKETETKRGGRKPDPMTQLINDLKTQIKNLGEVSTFDYPAHTARHYDERANAWGRQYGKTGTTDGLILSLAYEALSSLNDAERRYSLVQLAAASLVVVERLEDGK